MADRTKRQGELFADDRRHRAKRRVLMHVADAGNSPWGKVVQFVCHKCGHDTGWIEDRRTVSENKRGLPCPKCNEAPE
jgi:DNA-directed RNA polymerase subunit RPC12/RpoP